MADNTNIASFNVLHSIHVVAAVVVQSLEPKMCYLYVGEGTHQ